MTIITCTVYHRRNYPRAFGIKMVEAAEGHGTFPVATTMLDDDPLLELAIFDALDWSDMWDDVCCSGCIRHLVHCHAHSPGLSPANCVGCVMCYIGDAGSL